MDGWVGSGVRRTSNVCVADVLALPVSAGEDPPQSRNFRTGGGPVPRESATSSEAAAYVELQVAARVFAATQWGRPAPLPRHGPADNDTGLTEAVFSEIENIFAELDTTQRRY